MRAEFIHVSYHAQLRWLQRVGSYARPDEIEVVVKKSRIVKKKEMLPYSVPRLKNSVYSIYEEILFVLEPVSMYEYNLVTLYTYTHVYKVPLNFRKYKKRYCMLVS